MKHFLKLTWEIEQRGKRFFVSEATTGDQTAAGSVLIGPFDSRDACEIVMTHRRTQMGTFLKDLRGQLERAKVVIAQAEPEADSEDEAA